MEEAIEQVTVKCKEFTFWHKLYADDLVVSVKYSHLEKFLTKLYLKNLTCASTSNSAPYLPYANTEKLAKIPISTASL